MKRVLALAALLMASAAAFAAPANAAGLCLHADINVNGTAQTIDQEVSKIVEGQYQRAKRILAENKDKLSALATQLLEKEVIFKEDLEKIFGDRPFHKPEAPVANGNGKSAITPEAAPAEEGAAPQA